MDKKLFIITNRKLIKKGDLVTVVKKAVKGGADAIILREKDLNKQQLTSLAKRLMEVTAGKVPLIINSNLEVAKGVKADGIHFTYDSFIKFTEEYDGLMGVSIHSLEEAEAVTEKGADYILSGNIFETTCKPGLPGKGLDFLERISKKTSVPIIAIGGINADNINEVIRAGAAGVAVMSSVMEAEDVEQLVSIYKNNMKI
jgi:thiamine-phosphate pyrophosphorylase